MKSNLIALRETHIPTPLGPMVAMAEERGLVLLEFSDRPELPAEVEELRTRYGYAVMPGSSPHLELATCELAAYFAGEGQVFTVPLMMPGSEFQQRVWTQLQTIPYGATRTYGQIAGAIGSPSGSRAVGAANGQNRIAVVVPCHRVIGADGGLTGYSGGQSRKAHLLRLERGQDVVAEKPQPVQERLFGA